MGQNEVGRDLSVRREPLAIQLGENSVIDLSGLTDAQAQALKIKHAELTIARVDRTHKLAADVHALDSSLSAMAGNTMAVAAEGGNVTVTNTRDDHLGRTEIIMGTSDAAKAGKLNRSQTGRGPAVVIWVAVGAITGVVVTAVIASALFAK